MSLLSKLEIIKTPTVDIIDIPANEIRILADGRALIFGQDAKFNSNSFRSLLKANTFENATIETLDNVSDGAGFDTVNAVLRKSRANYTLAFDGREVTRFGSTDKLQGNMTGDAFYSVMEALLNHRPDLEVDSIHVDSDGFGAVVNFMNSQELTHPLMREEAIKQGMSLDFDRFTGISFQSFVQRLVCTNGMIGKNFNERRQLNLTTDPGVWYEKLFNEASNASIVEKYWDAITAAGGTQLSVRELNLLNGYLFKNFEHDVEKMSKTVLGDSSWRNEYTARGWDIEDFNADQAAMAPTPVNKWSAINVLTDVVSHPTKSYVTDRTRNEGMKLAGELLYKYKDSKSWLLNLPTFNN